MVSVFLFQNIFFCLETHYYLCERNLFFCDAKFVVPQACSQITILAAVFIESNTDAIAVKLNLDFFFFLKFICKCAHYLPFLLCLTLSWCHIQKVPVSYYCPLQFIKHTEMRSIRQKVFDALELVKSEIQSSEIQTAVVAGYYSVIWLFCF